MNCWQAMGYGSNVSVDTSTFSQRTLQAQLDNNLVASLKEESNLRDQTRLNTVASPHASAWLRAIPNVNLGLTLPKHEFVVAVKLWLGIPIFPSLSNSIRYTCGHIIDVFGDHLLGCGHGPLRTKRHDALRDIVYHALLVDNGGVRIEQKCGSESNNRPGDVFHPDFVLGHPAYFDVSVRNTMQPAYITKSANVAGTAAMAGEEEKDLRHDNEVTAAGGNFYPLVVESYGYWTPSSLESLKTIAAKTTSRNRTTFSQAFNNLMQQLSVRIWQYNARMINCKINLDVDFDFWDLPTMGGVG